MWQHVHVNDWTHVSVKLKMWFLLLDKITLTHIRECDQKLLKMAAVLQSAENLPAPYANINTAPWWLEGHMYHMLTVSNQLYAKEVRKQEI